MNQHSPTPTAVFIIEDELQFSLEELCRICEGDAQWLTDLVQHGALDPLGNTPQDWRFQGTALRRVRTAWRLTRDLQINAAGAALALDLLDEIQLLKQQLKGVRG